MNAVLFPHPNLMASSSGLQEFCALIGLPVAGNPTQYMMEKAFAAAGLDWRFLSVEVAQDALSDAVRGMKAMGFRGASVARPHKAKVAPFLDRVSEACVAAGAVSCIDRQNAELVGENFDGPAFRAALGEDYELKDKHLVLLGAGSIARAVSMELGMAGAARLTVVHPPGDRGRLLAETVTEKTATQASFVPWEDAFVVPSDTDVLINATTGGANDGKGRLALEWRDAKPALVVVDSHVGPSETQLMREARQASFRAVDGVEVLVHHAVLCFKLWTGIEPDAVLLRESADEFLWL